MDTNLGNILVVDDETNIRKLLAGVLTDEGYHVTGAGAGLEADAILNTDVVDLILLDVQLPGEDGLSLLKRWRKSYPLVPVIMMSGHGTIQTAVKATLAGAIDFIEKPIQVERLLLAILNSLQLQSLQRENLNLRDVLDITSEIIGTSPAILELRSEIARIAPTNARVFITGENGTGKELVARALHAASQRGDRPFIKVNCAAIPSELLESELFGHERGAFTGAVKTRRGKFELAQNGTLLLDEVGDMNPTTQAKLLRVLEENEMERVGSEQSIKLDVRLLASTNRNIEEAVRVGDFRQDLYHRLKVVPVHIAPLRMRTGDVEVLCIHYLKYFCRRMGRPERTVMPAALELMAAYNWPGNVRELKNLMERLIIMSDEPEVQTKTIKMLLRGGNKLSSESGIDELSTGTLAQRLKIFELHTIQSALQACGGNIAAAARELGLDRANLSRKIKRLDSQQ